MALITSAATGNFSATATWNGGVVPVAGDEARASTGHTITINVDTTCDEVSNAGTGIYTLASGVTLTANVTSKSATTSRNCLQFTAASPAAGAIVGNVAGGTVASAVGAFHNSTGTLTITGNVTGGSGATAIGATNNSTGTLNITGSVLAGGNTSAIGANNASSGVLNITGNVTGGSASNAFGVNNQSTGTTTVTGNVTGGTIVTANGAHNVAAGTVTIVGSATAAPTAIGANNNSTGTLTATRAVGNAFGIGAAGGTALAAGLNSVNIGSDTRAEELEYGPNGGPPAIGAVRIVAATNNRCFVTLTTSAQKTLADPSDATGQAAIADVRSGTVYALGNLTGTCAVPAAGSVALGVPTDNTTGTAVLTPAAVWDTLTSGLTTAGSIGERLKNAATVGTTGQALADALTPEP